jgi:hypothetical protein
MGTAEPFPPNSPQSLRCRRDEQPMTLVKTIPGIGAYPELRTYRCAQCGHVETIEVKP